MAIDLTINYSSGEFLEPKKKQNLGERFKLAELDNFNTPDLEQSPDSFLKPGETLEEWDETFRRPNAYGGLQREGFADGPPGKLVIQKPKMTLEKQKISASPLKEDYLGQLADKRKVRTSTLDDAFEVRNIIVKNKGHVGNIEELGRLVGIVGSGGKVDHRKTKLALDLALDSFDELKGFKLADAKYPNINAKKFRYLDMVAKSFANYNMTDDAVEAAAHLLPDNMGMIVDMGGRTDLEKGFFNLRGKISSADKKFISDRVATLTGKDFNIDSVNELIEETSKVRSAQGSIAAQIKRNAAMNKEIKTLAEDSIIKNLLKGDLNNKTQTKLLERATELVGGDASIASRRLFQMAEAMSQTTDAYKNLGIKINNNIADKIIATGKQIGGVNNRYGMSSALYNYYGNVVDKALGATEGKTFIGKYQQQIKKLLDAGKSPDEIFGVTASARRGLSPYAIFTQSLRTDVNSAIKGAYIDSALSTKHQQLQEIFKGRPYDKLSPQEKTAAQNLVSDFEKIKREALNKPVNPGEVRKGAKPIYLTKAEKRTIQLPEFDLKNPPSKSIKGYDQRFKKYPKIKKAFEESYKKVGYGMKVTPQMLTQKEFIQKVPGKVIAKKAAKSAGAKVLYPAMVANALLFGDRFSKGPWDFPLTPQEDAKQMNELGKMIKDKFAFATGGPVVPTIPYRENFEDGSEPEKKMSDEEILESIRRGVFELEQNWNTEKSIPGKVLDVADVTNWPYYATRMLRAGMNVAEISAKLPFVSMELLGKLATQPAFKVVDAETNRSAADMGLGVGMMEGMDDSWLTDQPQKKLEGTGLFTEAFKKLMPGSFADKTGLNSLIESQEQAMQDKGMSKWPEIAGKNIEMGLDVTLPFGYIAAANKYKSLKKLLSPLVKKDVNKVIEEALTEQGMSRRDFNTLIASGGMVAAIKALGLDTLFKGARAAKELKAPIQMLKNTSTKMPVWFPKFIDEINKKMTYEGSGMYTFKGTDDFLPGFHIERIGDDYYITGKNDYGQEFQVTYESPKWEGDKDGGFYNQGEFKVDDSEPVFVDPDGNVDFDGVTVDEVDDVLGGTKAMEEVATGTKRKTLTKGEEKVIDAEVRAQSEYDMARDEGYFDDVE